jgi:hypothetical protein
MFKYFGGDEADTGGFAILPTFAAAAIISRAYLQALGLR